MDGMFENEEEQLVRQAEAWKYTFAFVDSLAIKLVILLGIPNIIGRHGPSVMLSLSQIMAELPSEKPDINCLFKILCFLVAKKFFQAEAGVELKYALTPASKWFLKDGGAALSLTMSAMLPLLNDVQNVTPWHYLNECVLEGSVAFKKAHSIHVWDYAAAHPEYNNLFNKAMACSTRIVIKAILSKYEGFQGLNSLVDTGGCIRVTLAEVVKAYPTINGINYDLPHIIATAPHFTGMINFI